MTAKENNPDTGNGQNGGYQNRKTSPPFKIVGWWLAVGQFAYLSNPLPKLLTFILLVARMIFKQAYTGRQPTCNVAYAFIGLISSQNTHIYDFPKL